MSDDFIKMINNIDFLYRFIYECANLINNLYDYDNYDHLAIKLCSKFVMPIINITKKEHIKEYNEYVHYTLLYDIKDIIDNLGRTKDIYSICTYLMNICCERYFKLSQDEYLKIKEFINNNIDIIESALAPMNDYFDLYKKCYGHYYCLCYNYHKKKVRYIFPGNEHREFHEKIIKLYFNVWYIKFFYLLQKEIELNIRNISVLINIFINLYDNSNIDCNRKIEINYMICIIILFLISSFIVINIKIIFSLVIINSSSLLLIHI